MRKRFYLGFNKGSTRYYFHYLVKGLDNETFKPVSKSLVTFQYSKKSLFEQVSQESPYIEQASSILLNELEAAKALLINIRVDNEIIWENPKQDF